jgi:iron complex transport system substrate-binding protein
MNKHTHLLILIMALAISACAVTPVAPTGAPTAPPTVTPPPATAVPQPTVAPTSKPAPPTANLTSSCATNFDASVDYFPEKAAISYAKNFKVEYAKSYKVVTVMNAWREAKDQFQYVLVQCGAPKPSGYDKAQMIEVPSKSVIATSTTQVPFLEQAGALDKLVALDSLDFVSNVKVRDLIKQNKIKAVGGGPQINIEQVLNLKPDFVMTSGLGVPEFDTHPKLMEAKINTVIDASYMEQTPLGQAEWSKFVALFFNQEAKSSQAFDAIQKQYNDLAAKARAATKKPTLFNNMPYKDSWTVPGGKSYAAQLFADAGASYLWADDTSTGSLSLKFEQVFEKANKADVWLANAFAINDLAAIKKADARYANFAAFKSGAVWNNDARVNENGGNDYYESGAAYPNLVLADLVKILQPDLAKDHTLVYYRQLK